MSLCLDKTNCFHFLHRHDLLKINLYPTVFQKVLKHKVRYYLWVLLSPQHPLLEQNVACITCHGHILWTNMYPAERGWMVFMVQDIDGIM